MGKIYIFRNGSVTFCKSTVTFRNDPQFSITLRYALYRLHLAHAVGECILRRWGNNALFPNDFGEDLFVFCLVHVF